ncbi:hypothetical protein ANANG_G00179220 [Anguilla anguilla]|uniref:Uncharacterized protein n=1 Tax=Anguilla anguilla TaxID=7936 RepID=A0A9D3MBH6_ANGAN|nr:hypothetical protein ANANG_G00179220 [Anguilla anguilla]
MPLEFFFFNETDSSHFAVSYELRMYQRKALLFSYNVRLFPGRAGVLFSGALKDNSSPESQWQKNRCGNKSALASCNIIINNLTQIELTSQTFIPIPLV